MSNIQEMDRRVHMSVLFVVVVVVDGGGGGGDDVIVVIPIMVKI